MLRDSQQDAQLHVPITAQEPAGNSIKHSDNCGVSCTQDNVAHCLSHRSEVSSPQNAPPSLLTTKGQAQGCELHPHPKELLTVLEGSQQRALFLTVFFIKYTWTALCGEDWFPKNSHQETIVFLAPVGVHIHQDGIVSNRVQFPGPRSHSAREPPRAGTIARLVVRIHQTTVTRLSCGSCFMIIISPS